jgi:hypothetical protein
METIEQKIFDLLYSGQLCWTVNKEQLYTQDGNIATGGFATRRSDNGNILGIVGSRYAPLQNQQLAKEFLESTEQFDFKKIEATQVNGGKKVVIKAYIGDIQIGKDTVHRYITVSNTHDGSAPIMLGIFNKVLVCSNGMMREVNHKELARVKHTTNAGEKMNWYIRNIPLILAEEEKMIKTYQSLAQVKVTEEHIKRLIKTVYKVDMDTPEEELATRTVNRVKEFDDALTKNGLNLHGRTLWGVLQSMTYLNSHDKKGTVTDDYMSGAKYEMSNMTYDLLVRMMHEETLETAEIDY